MTDDEGMTNFQDARQDDGSSWLNDERLVREEPDSKPVYNLEERTARFGEAVIDFAKSIPRGPTTDRIISQLVGAGTSVGENYVEADDSISKKEFLKCIGTCKKEARETKHFLRMAVRGAPQLKPEARKLWMEARELHLIFSKIWRSGKNGGRSTNSSSFVIRASFVIRHSSFVICLLETLRSIPDLSKLRCPIFLAIG